MPQPDLLLMPFTCSQPTLRTLPSSHSKHTFLSQFFYKEAAHAILCGTCKHISVHMMQYLPTTQHTLTLIKPNLTTPAYTLSQWIHLGRRTHTNAQLLLLIAGVEPNPGPHEKKLKLCHVNINSITTPGKRDELACFTDNNDIDILMLTETKLNDTVHPSLYELPHFQTPFLNNRTRHGGGTATYVRQNISATRVTDLELDGEEWTWTMIKISNVKILTCCLYLPPNLSTDRLNDFTDRLSDSISAAQCFSPTSIMILGDFNSGNVYLDSKYSVNSGTTLFDMRLKDCLETLNMTQLIDQPTRVTKYVANLRDLVVTNNTQLISDFGILPPFSTLDHYPVFATLNISPPIMSHNTVTVWDYDKLNAEKMTQVLIDTDWDRVLEGDINSSTEKFTEVIIDAASKAIPVKTITIQPRDKPWMTSFLKHNMNKRDRLFRLAQRRQTTEDWDKWRQQRNRVTYLNRQQRDKHIQATASKLVNQKHNPFKYHKTLKTLIGRKKGLVIPPLESTEGDTITDEQQKANLLNEHFASQTQLGTTPTLPDEPDTHEDEVEPVPNLSHITVEKNEVLGLLNSLDVHKSTGPDKLPAKILKLSALLIYEPLTKLFNKSLSTATFPNMWKTANITPIFKKKGSALNPVNYRPISLLSCLSKILERVVFNRIYEHLTTNRLLSDKQSGYRPHHSTQLQLAHMTHELYKSLDQGRNFTTVYLDITKYFDKIWHSGLLYKCQTNFNITGKVHDWLKSYLTDRQHRVRVGNTYSCLQTINAGCPQGSILGPLLAILYLDGLADKTENTSLFYADDISLFSTYTTQTADDTQESLQRDLNLIEEYGKQWAITFSPSKTVCQTFTNNHQRPSPTLTFAGQVIPTTDSHKHLGLTLSTDLRFHNHVNEIIRKVNTAISPLYSVAPMLPRTLLEQIYTTYIRPYFDYCDAIFDGHLTTHDERRLETLQNRAARLVTGTYFRTSTDRLRLELGWDRLATRREIHRLTLFWHLTRSTHVPEYIKNTLPHPRHIDTDRTLRNSNTLTLPENRTSQFQKSFIPRTTRKWNKLPESTRSHESSHTFKKDIISLLGVKHPPHYYTIGSKRDNVIHTQLRVGNSDLNAHLFQTQKHPHPHCQCGHRTETTAHFMLHCPLYTELRQTLFQSISAELNTNFTHFTSTKQYETLLHGTNINTASSQRVAHFVQKFIHETKRFH